MRIVERVAWVLVGAALATVVSVSAVARRGPSARAAAGQRPRAEPGVRLTMAALHQQGGVPLGWQLSPPPGDAAAGRASFDRLGCPACHRVAGESFASAVPAPTGPELTGMGSHHPSGYFAEAILNPDAVLIDEPGYVGEDGHSRMPTYDDLTLGELADLVAYLGSLRDGGSPSCHGGGSAASAPTSIRGGDRPSPPAGDGRVFFAQSYDVLPGRLGAFETWWAAQGRRGFLDAQGVVAVDTFVDAAKPAGALTTVIGFRDDAALRTFLADPAMAELWQAFDAFVGPHGHVTADGPLVYRVPALSGE